jgi:hypothetical protein
MVIRTVGFYPVDSRPKGHVTKMEQARHGVVYIIQSQIDVMTYQSGACPMMYNQEYYGAI